jgi:hypothetical protein
MSLASMVLGMGLGTMRILKGMVGERKAVRMNALLQPTPAVGLFHDAADMHTVMKTFQVVFEYQ